ncbi:hypothetical protein K493DRAFT_329607 [Basidiobolus meristosporus CBS 931.73]|uniref:Vacuolar protein sorting-associated protein n=1 Tax=Basidiobolus meristosporus CBS 931.73 TaxID=1314790 RepID=A0A1Y1YEI3_9FUNG|nr:hypothetical protein K493DRAFT_329607 [Basidiobolus meristosporus CBS 931.73]|eukprot:ORX96417.1 hypothetical protein K493DRAFT_329607 [Basidiobolus meristosporus CBS 931.73]
MFETIVANILNKFLGSYVTNLETAQLGIGIWQGDVVLRGLRLKKEALDKFNLPVNVLEGYLGELTLKIPWKNLKNQPVRVFINNVYLLAVPKGEDTYDPEEEEEREQALKQQRLTSYEDLQAQSRKANPAEDFKSMSFTMQLVTKIVDNLQVSINNIHIRYEDKTSNPKRPFAFGMTLSELSAVSTNADWQEVFVDQSFDKIHKLLKLESLTVYWNTRIETFAGKSYPELIEAFTKMITSDKNQKLSHQFILKPVSGVGRLMLNKTFSEDVPKNIALLLFEEFGFTLDNEQYQDILLVADLVEYSARQKMYRKYSPPRHVLPKDNPRAWFQYAIRCVLSEIKERNRRWTWSYFAQRCEQRRTYVRLYVDFKLNRLAPEDEVKFHDIEWDLSFEDIRMYRFLSKSLMKKEKALLARQQQMEQPAGWFGGWFGGWSSEKQAEEESEVLTSEQKQELLATIDFDESQPESAFEISEECVILSLTTQIKTGSLALKESPHSKNHSIASLVFDTVTMEFVNRPDSFRSAISLHGLNLYDGTTKDTLYPLLMRVDDSEDDVSNESLSDNQCFSEIPQSMGLQSSQRNPFFRLVFEHNPMDNRADDALSIKMRYLEVIYNQHAIETILKFFKPPVSQMESMTALMEAAGNTLDGLTQQTRAGIKYALEEHKTLDVSIDINAPIFIFPESPTDPNAQIVVFDSGHITVQSKLVSKEQKIELEEMLGPNFSLENNPKLEKLLYDRFLVEMSSVQILVGQSIDTCLRMIQDINLADKDDYLVLDRINMSFLVDVSIIPKAPNITGLRVSGRLPLLKVNISNTKYKAMMRLLEVISGPKQENIPESGAGSAGYQAHRHSVIGIPFPDEIPVDLLSEASSEHHSFANENSEVHTFRDDDGDDEFFDAEEVHEGESSVVNFPNRKLIEFTFEIEKLSMSLRKTDGLQPYSEISLADMHLHRFALVFTQRPYDMNATVTIQSLYIDDCISPNPNFKHIITSDIEGADGQQQLVQLVYKKASPESPEYMSKFESIDQSLELCFSSVNVIITSRSILTLYDFLLTTFVSEPRPNGNPQLEAMVEPTAIPGGQLPPSTTRIIAKMNSINLILNDDGVRLSTISLLRGDVALLLKQNGLRIGAKLGNISVTDDVKQEGNLHSFRPLFTIHSDQLAVFRYETFPMDDTGYPGYDSSVFLRVGSVRMTYMEKPIQDLLRFTSKFAEMHVLFETARQAAAESAAQLHNSMSRMHIDIDVRTPIVVFPKKMNSKDTLNINLGEISMTNTFTSHPDSKDKSLDNIRFRIKDIRLTSSFYFPNAPHQVLQIIDDVDIELNIVYGEHIKNSKRPDTEATGTISDIKMSLTQAQYLLLLEIANSVSRTFSGSKELRDSDAGTLSRNTKVEPSTTYTKTTLPIRRGAVAIDFWTLIDLRLIMKTVYLEIFAEESSKSNMPINTSLCSFSLNNFEHHFQMLTNGAMQADLRIHSMVIVDTRPETGNVYKEIVPIIDKTSPQFSVNIRTKPSGAVEASVSIDSPKVTLVLDQLFGIRDFFMSAFQHPEMPQDATPNEELPRTANEAPADQRSSMNELVYNIHIIDPEIILLADANSPSTEAIVLSIRSVTLRQKGTINITLNSIALFLCRMDKREDTTLRVIENFDMILSMDRRFTQMSHTLTNIHTEVFPVIIRISYRDALLFSNILSKVTELLNHVNPPEPQASLERGRSRKGARRDDASLKRVGKRRETHRDSLRVQSQLQSQLNRIFSRENMKLTFNKVEIIFIRDLDDLPIIDIQLQKFVVEVKDWSSQLIVSTDIQMLANMFNIKNSHWEPLVEPWQFSIKIDRPLAPATTQMNFESKRQFDLNIAHSFLETTLSLVARMNQPGENTLNVARGVVIPYLLRNRTGFNLYVWAESTGDNTSTVVQKLADGHDLPWRFDDWRKTRENTSVARNRLGLQFETLPLESVKDIPVDTEGTHFYVLRPKMESVSHRLVCEVKLKDSTKIVTFRSPLMISNSTPVPLEMVMVDYRSETLTESATIPPGEDYPVNLIMGFKNAIKVRPKTEENYDWSTSYIYWREFLTENFPNTITCESSEASNSLRFQVYAKYDRKDPLVLLYPCMTLKISAPLEIENLLPYDFNYNIVDRSNDLSVNGSLKRGDIRAMHTFQLGSLLCLNVEIGDAGFAYSDFVTISTNDPVNAPVQDTISLTNPEGVKLNLRISYFEIPESGGACRFSIYSPFLIINKTGLDMYLKTSSNEVNTVYARDEDASLGNKQLPYLYSPYLSQSQNRASIKIADSEWTKPISFEAIGSETSTIIPMSARLDEFHLGMSADQGRGKYRLTRIITFTPRFILKNNMKEKILLREPGSSVSIPLEPKHRAPLHFVRQGEEKQLMINFPSFNKEWSAPFNIEDVGKIFIKIRKPGIRRDLVRVDIHLEGPTIFILFKKEEGKWPFRIENESGATILLYQPIMPLRELSSPQPSPTLERTKQIRYKLGSGDTMAYSWDYPASKQKSLVLNVNGFEREITLCEIGPLIPLNYKTADGRGIMAIDIVAEGPVIVVHLSKYDQSESIYKPATPGTTNSSVQDADFEVIDMDSIITFSLKIKLEGIGISFLNRHVREIIYSTFRGIELNYSDSTYQTSMNFMIKWLQIDNQSYEGLKPIILYPTLNSKLGKDVEIKPTFRAAVVKAKDTSHGVEWYKYITVWLQEVSFDVDEDFLMTLLDFSKFNVPGWGFENQGYIGDESMDIPEPALTEGDTQLYFEVIHIQPLKINLSFSRTAVINQGRTTPRSYNPLMYIVNVLTMTIGNIDAAPIKLNALVMHNVMVSYPVLIDRFSKHYSQEVFYQVHKVVGSVDFLGNPVKLFNTVSSGVIDFFYEPYQGFIMNDRAQDLGIGLAKGAASFLSKMIYGFSDSFSKFTDSVGKGLSVATLDQAFQDKRRMTRTRNKPRHAFNGVTRGASSLATSFASGISGLVTQPIAGAEKGGLGGFFRGIGKGLVGVVTKPVVGVFDMANNVTEGIRNTTILFDQNQSERIRLPRYVGRDGILRRYDPIEAQGQYWLKEVDNGSYFNETYIAHLELRGTDRIALLSYSYVMVVRIKKTISDFVVSFEDLQTPIISATGINLVRTKQLSDPPSFFIPIANEKDRTEFYHKLENTFNQYTVERRSLD